MKSKHTKPRWRQVKRIFVGIILGVVFLVLLSHANNYYLLHTMDEIEKPLALRAHEAYLQARHLSDTGDQTLKQSLQAIYETAWEADTKTIDARFARFAAFFKRWETFKEDHNNDYNHIPNSWSKIDEYTHEQWLELGVYLEQNKDLLEEMRTLAVMKSPICPLKDTGYATIFRHPYRVEIITRWMLLAAGAYAHRGNTDKAFDYMMAAFHSTELLAWEPSITAYITNVSLERSVAQNLGNIFAPGALSAAQVEEVVQWAKAKNARPRSIEHFRSDLYHWKHIVIDNSEQGVSIFSPAWWDSKNFGDYPVMARLFSLPGPNPLRTMNFSRFASVLQELERLSSLPLYEAQAEHKALIDQVEALPSAYCFLHQLADHYYGVQGMQASVESSCDLLWMGLTLEQHYVEHGEYPVTLEAAIPDAPLDLSTGEPYRYLPRDNDFFLYGLGSNDVDDGGYCNKDKVWRNRSTPETVLAHEKKEREEERERKEKRRLERNSEDRRRRSLGEGAKGPRRRFGSALSASRTAPVAIPPTAIPLRLKEDFRNPMLSHGSGNSYILPGMPLDGPCIAKTWATDYANCTMAFYSMDFTQMAVGGRGPSDLKPVAAWREPVGYGEMVMNATAGDLDGDGANEIVLTIRRDNPGIHVLNWNAETKALEPRWAYTWKGGEKEPFHRGTAVGNFTDSDGLEICFGNDYGALYLLDKDGNLITKATDGPHKTIQRIDTCDTDQDGYHEMIVSTGRAPGEVHLMRWDPEAAALEVVWSTNVTIDGKGGNNCYEAVFHANGHPDGGPAIAASTEQEEGDHQGSVLLLDMDGKILWQRFHDQSGNAEAGRRAADGTSRGSRRRGVTSQPESNTEGRAGGCGFGDLTGDGVPEIFTRYTGNGVGLLIYDNHGNRLDKIHNVAASSAGPHTFQPNGPNTDPTYIVTTNEVYQVLREDEENITSINTKTP